MSSAPDGLPAFVIAIDGRELDQSTAEEVIRIEVALEVGRLAHATVLLRNWDPDTNTAEESDQGGLGAGRAISIRLGYDDDLTEVFEGLVVAAVAQCRAGSLPQLELRCRCRGIQLLGTPRYRVWTDQSDHDAVGSLCREAGLEIDGASGFKNPFVVQHRVNDWGFMLARAAALGLQPYVHGKTLNFKPAQAGGAPAASLEWGSDIIDLELVQDITGAIGDAAATAWDPESKQAVRVKTAASAARSKAGKRPSRTDLMSKAKIAESRAREVAGSVPMDQAELEAWTQALVDRGATDSYHGDLKCEGNPDLRIDSTVEIEGLGSTFDGPYYVTRVRQRLASGRYETELGLGTPPAPTPHGRERDDRVMPAVDSLVIAIVESFEDTDRKQGRVQVKFPWMSADEAPVWARLATPAGGSDRGFVFVPEPDDEVLVQYVDGDPRHPVVVGSLWNGKDAPPDTYDPEKNDRRSIVSRAGHRFTFHDGDDTPGVSVETAAGQSVRIDDTSGSEAITLKDKTGNELRMNDGGIALVAASGKTIELSAAGGSIELSAKEINATADAAVTIKGNSGATLESSATATVKGGSDVSIDGGGMLVAKAGMIKLN